LLLGKASCLSGAPEGFAGRQSNEVNQPGPSVVAASTDEGVKTHTVLVDTAEFEPPSADAGKGRGPVSAA